jgi:hypothetical protein
VGVKRVSGSLPRRPISITLFRAGIVYLLVSTELIVVYLV